MYSSGMEWLRNFLGYFGTAVVSILPIMNPLGAVPLVMSLTRHMADAEREQQIRQACIYALALMAGFFVAGSLVMQMFGLSIPGMRIAGGVIVAVLGFNMMFPSSEVPLSSVEEAARYKTDIAFSPLAMPGLSGPGTFAVVMSLSSQVASNERFERVVDFLGVLTGIIVVALIAYLVLRASARLNRLLGPTGVIAMTHLMGFLMICIGVQFMINGLGSVMQDPSIWSGLAQALSQQSVGEP
jgi:multiple antibiotic resistance protein